MSRRASALLSWLSSFAVAYLVGSTLRDRRTGLLAGFGSATVAAAVSWAAYGVVDSAERSLGAEVPRTARETDLDGR